MSEWGSLLLVYWLLWALEGWRMPPAPHFGVTGLGRRARLDFARVLPPTWLPLGWTAASADIAFSFSPAGVANRPAGTAGRPADAPAAAVAWRWSEIREAAIKDGWMEINGRRAWRDTGHLGARQLLDLAKLPEAERTARLGWLLRRWLRPAHLRRRARMLRARTGCIATANFLGWIMMIVLTAYLLAGGALGLPAKWTLFIASLLGGWLLTVALLHGFALIGAWWASRRLRPVAATRRVANLFTALLLPPQALRLRAVLSDGWFPAQHPLAYALAFGSRAQREEIAFDTLADLRWPVRTERDAPLAGAIAAWFRAELRGALLPLIAAAGIEEARLLAAPAPDSAESVRYCPRCRCQFNVARERCPHGVALLPLERAACRGRMP